MGLTDSEVIDKALNDKTGADFRRLWDGDYSAYRHDDSRGDFAIARKLNSYTGDPEQTERIMRGNTNIARNKWDSHRTYLVDTITKAEPDDFYAGSKGWIIAHPAQVSSSLSLKDRGTSDTSVTTLEYPNITVVDVGHAHNRPPGQITGRRALPGQDSVRKRVQETLEP